MVRDVGLAEELAQDALVAALERWPESGVPDNPGAWLMATAKHRAIDLLRRNKLLEQKHEELGHELAAQQETADRISTRRSTTDVGDDLLRPRVHGLPPGALDRGARGAHAATARRPDDRRRSRAPSSCPEPTIAQRIVRAKRTLADGACRSRCRAAPSWRRAWRRCSRSST